jgi:starch synthase
MRVAYLNYGNQSGVTPSIAKALATDHEIINVDPTDALALRDPKTRLPRVSPRVALALAMSGIQYGRKLLQHRWNTGYAFDQHSKRAGELLRSISPAVHIVLQNGALFVPGDPPAHPYVLLLDNTSLLAQRQAAIRASYSEPRLSFGDAWFQRERDAYRNAAAIATFSEVVRRSLVEDYGTRPNRIAVVGAGANVVPATDPARRDDGRTLLFIGKEWERKGGPVLLRAFEMLRRRRPDLRLVLAGPPATLAVPEGVTNLSVVPFDTVQRLLSEATVFVLPTLQEPFGIAFVDAMLCKVPCVGTQVGAVPEIVGEAGICVPPGDSFALALAVERLLDAPALRVALGEAGRNRALAKGYLWPEVGKRLSPLLESAALRRRAA